MSQNNKVLEIRNLRVGFQFRGSRVEAIRHLDLDVFRGDFLGIVGESGSGKSLMMKAIMGLLPENAYREADRLIFLDQDLLSLNDRAYRHLRGSKMTMIFQDPLSSLNPLQKIGYHLEEVLLRHRQMKRPEARQKSLELLSLVGIPSPKERLSQYPHEFSGGMRQRVLIAMALACNPELLIADEPTTALDVTIQAQILDLLKEIQKKLNTTIVLITHDMGVVATVCDRIAIMYGGQIMEQGTVDEIFYQPRHPYTRALLSAIPKLDLPPGQRLLSIPGRPPTLRQLTDRCPFYERCPEAVELCAEGMPPLFKWSETQTVACYRGQEEKK